MTLQELLKENYKDDMTVADIEQALKNVQLPTTGISKEALDKATADAAAWKKKYRDQLDDATRKQEEAEEKQRQTEEKLARYEKSVAISELTNEYLKLGYDADLAKSTATAQYDGNTEALFKNMKQHEQQMQDSIKDLKQKSTSPPPINNGGNQNIPSPDMAVSNPLGYVSQILDQCKGEQEE